MGTVCIPDEDQEGDDLAKLRGLGGFLLRFRRVFF